MKSTTEETNIISRMGLEELKIKFSQKEALKEDEFVCQH
jgi:hypothetical protein